MQNSTLIAGLTYSLIGVVFLFASCKTLNQEKTAPMSAPETITYAITYLNLIPLRAAPNHRSEMVSQVLFSEYVKVLKTVEEWSYIQLEQDTYKGWVETTQLKMVSKSSYTKAKQNPKVKVVEDFSSVRIDDKEVNLLKGTNLPFYEDGFFIFNGEKIVFSGKVMKGEKDRQSIVETAYTYLNSPYLWGGKTTMGLDCSGFSQIVYHQNGYSIQRDASLQAKQGDIVSSISEAKIGDLAFFHNEKGNITHVGIVLDNHEIIHAAKGKVHIDKLDEKGIYDTETKEYSHQLSMIRRYF